MRTVKFSCSDYGENEVSYVDVELFASFFEADFVDVVVSYFCDFALIFGKRCLVFLLASRFGSLFLGLVLEEVLEVSYYKKCFQW